ncbi:small heat shock protein B [Escherichia coli]|nr:small heat shock protein B [Escherichia coli]
MTNWPTHCKNAGESQSFPPYNIEKSDDNHYRITLALAGFRQEDLEIQLEGTRLSVKGTPEQPKEEKKMAASRAYESAI